MAVFVTFVLIIAVCVVMAMSQVKVELAPYNIEQELKKHHQSGGSHGKA